MGCWYTDTVARSYGQTYCIAVNDVSDVWACSMSLDFDSFILCGRFITTPADDGAESPVCEMPSLNMLDVFSQVLLSLSLLRSSNIDLKNLLSDFNVRIVLITIVLPQPMLFQPENIQVQQ
jgi:hypothetical protein